MYKEIDIDLPNGMQVTVWRAGDEVCLAVVNEKGCVVTDRKLSVNETDKLHSISHCP